MFGIMTKLYYKFLIGIVLFFSAIASSFSQNQVFDDSKLNLRPFEYDEVQLSESRIKYQFEEVLAYYLAIPNEDLLKGFRERAGLPTQGAKEMGGGILMMFSTFSGNL